jgi:hypothetical protein
MLSFGENARSIGQNGRIRKNRIAGEICSEFRPGEAIAHP